MSPPYPFPSSLPSGLCWELVAFAIRVEGPLTVLFLDSPGGGTRIIAFGEAPRGVRQAFAEIGDY